VSRLRRIGRSRPFHHNIVGILALAGATAYGVRKVLTKATLQDQLPAGAEGSANGTAISDAREPASASAFAHRSTEGAVAVEVPLNEDQLIFGEKLDGSFKAARIDGNETSGEDATTVVVMPGGRISIEVITEDHSSPIATFDLLIGVQTAS
jgi:hypothetical protein